VRAVEAVTLTLDAPGHETLVVTVPEFGEPRVDGAPRGSVEVHQRSYVDRWYCRIVLPDAWVGDRVGLAMLRRHADRENVESTPSTGAPWRPRAARLEIDTTQWDVVR
jgi:hypothetical protein